MLKSLFIAFIIGGIGFLSYTAGEIKGCQVVVDNTISDEYVSAKCGLQSSSAKLKITFTFVMNDFYYTVDATTGEVLDDPYGLVDQAKALEHEASQ